MKKGQMIEINGCKGCIEKESKTAVAVLFENGYVGNYNKSKLVTK